MRAQDIISILVTFAFGFAAGAYLYLTGFAEFMANLKTPSSDDISVLVIQGELYGGCRAECPSFQLMNDGSYRYLYTPEVGQEQVLRQGTLPKKMQRDIRKSLKESALVEQSQPVEAEGCRSYTDGVDVSYEITFKGKEYKLDSCGTKVDGGSDLWLALHVVWDYCKTVGNNQ